MSDQNLTAHQARVLACLMEKHLATPNNYPLTYNSLTNACNQKSNREPVMSLTEGQVGHTVGELSDLDLARVEYGERANKVTHRGPGAFKISREEQAVLAMMMLRAPMTLADIKARTERMVDLEGLDMVMSVVQGLIEREQPLVMLIPKGPGRREDRYTHLLCGEPDLSALEVSREVKAASCSAGVDHSRLAELEARVEKLEQAIQEMQSTN